MNIESFMDLPERSKGLDIIFIWEERDAMSLSEVLVRTDVVDATINRLGVQVACLPPNMTGVLQVLDLVVNGPIKARTRTLRGAKIVAAFGEFRKLYEIEMRKDVQERTLQVFQPPKPEC